MSGYWKMLVCVNVLLLTGNAWQHSWWAVANIAVIAWGVLVMSENEREPAPDTGRTA